VLRETDRMPTLFSRIIAGELPGTFVWKDEQCVAFLSIAPLTAGHTLVVPREEVDRWTDLPPELWAHLTDVAQVLGKAVQAAFEAPRAGVVLAGFEVPHTHVHVFPTWSMSDFDFGHARPLDDPAAALAEPAERIRAALRVAGRPEVA
jgi:histidine triad (HIT) family protein